MSWEKWLGGEGWFVGPKGMGRENRWVREVGGFGKRGWEGREKKCVGVENVKWVGGKG